MGKKVLFAPIGGNDPISADTEKDGSMLHICRVYKPDIVYLYLSKEMLERHREDDRYRFCIAKLGELLKHEFEIHIIERENLVEVQEYDYYYEDFRSIIQNIEEELGEDGSLLLNIASGTPAMKSALLVLATLMDYSITPIQVKTPNNSINRHKGKDNDYDVEYYWEANGDNEEGFKNRCKEVKCPNLITLLKKNIITKHIRAYDYTAALSLVNEIRDEISKKSYCMLEIAVARLQLDLSKVYKLSKEAGVDFIPVKESNKANIFEYALAMKIKIARKEYGDYVRAISPLICDLFEMILSEQYKINIHDFCKKEKGIWKLSIEKMNVSAKGKELLEILDEAFKGRVKNNTPVAASNLEPLLLHYLKKDAKIVDKKLIDAVSEIRKVENKVRNLAAHEIVSITDEKLQKILDNSLTIEQIYGLIKRLIIAARIHVKEEDWNSYDKMNIYMMAELMSE